MKWGFASTAALVLAQQKDSFYVNQLTEELKAVALDWLDIRTFLQWEAWIEGGASLLYWLLLTGSGNRSLGEEYVRIAPVDLKQKEFLLSLRSKRLLFAALYALLHLKREASESLQVINAAQFYWNGKFPTLLHRLLSIRYIFHPRKPPLPDADRVLYQSMAVLVTFLKAQKALNHLKQQQEQILFLPSSVNANNPKCPVCFDSLNAPVASALCGHVCCWSCLVRWREREERCPVCRIVVPEPEIVPIINL